MLANLETGRKAGSALLELDVQSWHERAMITESKADSLEKDNNKLVDEIAKLRSQLLFHRLKLLG